MTWFAVFSAVALTAAWYRVHLRTAAIAFAVTLLFYAFFGGSFIFFLLLALSGMAVFILLQLPPLRQEWITRPLLDALRANGAAADAVVATTTRSPADDWVGGAPDWAGWLSRPEPALTPLEQDFLDTTVETWCRAWPQPRVEADLAIAAVPATYGGVGLSVYAQQTLLGKIASVAGRPEAQRLARRLHCAAHIETLGDEAQKLEWLSRIARGGQAVALAASVGNGHAGPMPDLAIVERGLWKGREQPGLRLNYEKRASDATALDAVLVAVAVRGHPTVSHGWVWVPRATSGVSDDLHQARDAFVPLSHLMPDPRALAFAEPERVAPMAGRLTVLAERAATRLALRGSLSADENLLLARLGACVHTLEALRRALPDLDSAALRLVHARYCDDGLRLVQRLGLETEAVADGSLETAMRRARDLPTTRALRASLREDNPARMLTHFDEALAGHSRDVAQAAARSLLLGLTHGRLLTAPALGALSPYFGRVSRYSAAAGLLSAALPWLPPTPGRAVVQRELAIVWGRLCAAASLLRAFEHDGRPQADESLALWALADLTREIEQWLDSALHALPSRFFSVLLRVLMFPLGRWARPPRADWAAAIVQRLQDPRAAPLCNVLHRDTSLLRLRSARLLQQECVPLEARLQDSRLTRPRRLDRIHEALGLGLLSAGEAAQLRELHNLAESADEDRPRQIAVPAANLGEPSEYET